MYNEEFKKYQILCEQYYGKNNLLKEIDKAFDRIIANRGTYDITTYKQHDAFLPDLKLISNHFKTIFNFKDVVLFINANATVKASTMANIILDAKGVKDTMSNRRVKGKYGLQFAKPDRKAMIQINNDLLFMDGIKGEHLTCIILHEIGHNFFIEDSMSFITKFIGLDILYFNLLWFLKAGGNLHEFQYNTLNSWLRILLMSGHENIVTYMKRINIDDRSFITKLIRTSNEVVMSSLSLMNTFTFMAIPFLKNMRYSNPVERVIDSLVNFFNPGSFSLYKNEQFADNFATSYGYGPQMIEVRNMFMKNLTTGSYGVDKVLSSTVLPNAFYDFIGSYTELLTEPLKVRADDYVEALDQINYLKSLLNNEVYDEKTRKQIKKDLDEAEANLKKMHKQFLSFEKDGYLRKGKVMTGINKSIYAATNGGLGYKLRGKGYDNKGNWKYMI